MYPRIVKGYFKLSPIKANQIKINYPAQYKLCSAVIDWASNPFTSNALVDYPI